MVVERVLAPFWRWNPAALLVPEIAVAVRGLPRAFWGYRIALVTDLHHSRVVPSSWLHVVAERVRKLEPDLVVLGGDFVSHAPRELEGLGAVVAGFRARDGVVAVLGNHDHWVGADAVAAAVRAGGAELLENQHRMLTRDGERLAVAGVGDFAHGSVRLDEALAGIPSDVPRVLASHNPDLIEYLPAEARVDLMLAGHTHNGQIHFPLIGPLTVPSQFGGKYLHGLKRHGETWIYVSAGVGTAAVPFRWGNPPEVPVLKLERA
jgi:predicted MPP superfamily phosphohydrolase